MGRVAGGAPSESTSWDLGILFNYNDQLIPKKSAVAWESERKRIIFGEDVIDTGGSNDEQPQLIVNEYAAVEVKSLWINDCAGQSQVIACANGLRTLENITIDGGLF